VATILIIFVEKKLTKMANLLQIKPMLNLSERLGKGWAPGTP